jgi:hypothetical protein
MSLVPVAPLYLTRSHSARPLPLRLYRPCRSSQSLHSCRPRASGRISILTKYDAGYQLSLFPTRRTLPLRIRSSVRVPLIPSHATPATRSRRGQLRDFAKALPWFAASLQRSFRLAGELARSWLKLYHTSLQDRLPNWLKGFTKGIQQRIPTRESRFRVRMFIREFVQALPCDDMHYWRGTLSQTS